MTTINVFTSEDCGQCDAVVERAEALAAETDIEVAVHDVEEDRPKALEYGVFSVPTTVVGDTQTGAFAPIVSSMLSPTCRTPSTGRMSLPRANWARRTCLQPPSGSR